MHLAHEKIPERGTTVLEVGLLAIALHERLDDLDGRLMLPVTQILQTVDDVHVLSFVWVEHIIGAVLARSNLGEAA